MIVINRYASILLIITLLFVVSCGGGGSGGGGSATLAGQWQVTTTLTTSLCGDTPGTQDDYNIVVSQNGTQITVQGPYGSLTGSVNGDRASWTGQVFNSAFIFWFTITSLDIQFDDVGFSGTFSWERRNDQSGPVTCTGTSSLSGSRPSVPIPAAPTGLTATTLSSTDIQLSWSDNSSNEEGFRIYRVDNFGISTLIDIVGSGVENYTVQNLTPSTLHRFKATAYSPGGESFSSNIAEATTPSPPSPPLPAPTGLSVSRLARTNIGVYWTDNSSTETGFKIFRGLSSGSVNALAGTVGTDVTSYLDPLLNPSTTYHYQVRAYSPSGESDPSATSNATTLSEISGSWDLDLALTATSNPPSTTCGFSSDAVSGQATINRPSAFAIGSTTSFGVLTGVMPDDNSIAGLYGNLLIN
ncbi:MAG: fibronectin type III domain-containing protein, partial [bacterium]